MIVYQPVIHCLIIKHKHTQNIIIQLACDDMYHGRKLEID